MALDGLGSWGNNSIGKRSALAIGSLKNTTYFSLVGKLNGLRPAGGGDEVGVELIVSMTVSDFYSLHRDYQMRIGTPKETLCLLYLQSISLLQIIYLILPLLKFPTISSERERSSQMIHYVY
ncbi:hypothetical protein GOBAR_DD23830 [Gossypium barbadense]|nr:hypothetical protein GOBAR_DD23830 [Gossypium barbadense]